MAILVENNQSFDINLGGTVNQAFSCPVSSNRLLVVLVTERFVSAVTGVTYGGVALTPAGVSSDGGQSRIGCRIWYLVNPNSGSNTLAIIYSTAHTSVMTAVCLSGVDQAAPVYNYGIVQPSTQPAHPTITVVSAVNDLVIAASGTMALGGTETYTADAGQTDFTAHAFGSGTDRILAGHTRKAGAASVATGWTIGGTQASGDFSTLAALAIKASTTVNQPIDALVDDFVATTDPRWDGGSTDPGAVVTRSGGKVTLSIPLNPGIAAYGTYGTVDAYTIAGSNAPYIGISTATPAPNHVNIEFFFNLVLAADTSNKLQMQVYNGSVRARRQVAGVFTVLASMIYNSTTHRYLRIRENGGTVYWEYSATAVSTDWHILFSQSNPFSVTDLRARFGLGSITGTSPAASVSVEGFGVRLQGQPVQDLVSLPAPGFFDQTITLTGLASRVSYQGEFAAFASTVATGSGVEVVTATGLGIAANTWMTGSLKVARDLVKAGSLARVILRMRFTDASSLDFNSPDFNLTTSWQKIIVSGQVPAGKTLDQVSLRAVARSSTPTDIYATKAQVETKHFATPIIVTNTATLARSGARVRIPKQSRTSPIQGWFAARVRQHYTASLFTNNLWLLSWKDSANDRLSLYYNLATTSFRIERVAGGTVVASAARFYNYSDGQKTTVVAAWGASSIGVAVEDATDSSFVIGNSPAIPNLVATQIDVGSDAGVNQLNGEILWAVFGSGILTNANLQSFYQIGDSDQPLTSFPQSPEIFWSADTATANVV